jgi:hypothetical protein
MISSKRKQPSRITKGEQELKDKLLNKLIIKMIDSILHKEANELIITQKANPTDENNNALHSFVESLVNKRLEKMLGIRINLNNLQVLTQRGINISMTNNDYDYIITKDNIIDIPDSLNTNTNDNTNNNTNDNNTNDTNKNINNEMPSFDLLIQQPPSSGEIEFDESGDIILKAHIEEWDSDVDDVKIIHNNNDPSKISSIEKITEDEGNSFRSFMEEVETIEEMRSMCISMILDLKDRMKGCETCETCSQVVSILENNLAKYKKVTKLAQNFATLLMYIIDGVVPNNLNDKSIRLLNDLFVIIVKNSNFPDVCYLYEKYKQYININSYDGIILRLAIQKYKAFEVRIIIDWGCDITVLNHKPIIRAFYYEKFGLIKTLILKGSSYKFYLKAELNAKRYQKLQDRLDEYITEEAPNASELEKEFQAVILINAYRKMIQKKLIMEKKSGKIRSNNLSNDTRDNTNNHVIKNTNDDANDDADDDADDYIDDTVISKPGFIDDFVNFFYGSICNNPYYQLRKLITNNPKYIDTEINKMVEAVDNIDTKSNPGNPNNPNLDNPINNTVTTNKKKKKKKKKLHNPIPIIDIEIKEEETILHELSHELLLEEQHNMLNDETFNVEITQPEPAPYQSSIHSYFTELDTFTLFYPNQTIDNWKRDYPWCDGGIMLYWDWHFDNLMQQFTSAY